VLALAANVHHFLVNPSFSNGSTLSTQLIDGISLGSELGNVESLGIALGIKDGTSLGFSLGVPLGINDGT